MTNRPLEALRRRLEKLELEHLRRHAAELHERLEHAEAEATRANMAADMWQQLAMDMQETLYEQGTTVGLTKEGSLHLIANDDEPLVERRGQPIEMIEPIAV